MLDDNEVSLIIVRNTKVVQEDFGRLTHDHGAEELATEPSTTTGSDTRLNDGNLQVWASLAKHVCSAETARPGTDDDNVRFGVGVKVVEVAAGHGTRDLRLTDRSKLEALLPFVGHVLEGLGLVVVDWDRLHVERSLQGNAVGVAGLSVHGRWWRHDC